MSETDPPADPKSGFRMPVGSESLVDKVARLKDMYPGRLTLTDVAVILGVSKPAVVKYHQHRIPFLQVEGIKLFDAAVTRLYANTRRRTEAKSRIIITGINVERLQRICERYYRQNLDIGSSELLALAKKIARL